MTMSIYPNRWLFAIFLSSSCCVMGCGSDGEGLVLDPGQGKAEKTKDVKIVSCDQMFSESDGLRSAYGLLQCSDGSIPGEIEVDVSFNEYDTKGLQTKTCKLSSNRSGAFWADLPAGITANLLFFQGNLRLGSTEQSIPTNSSPSTDWGILEADCAAPTSDETDLVPSCSKAFPENTEDDVYSHRYFYGDLRCNDGSLLNQPIELVFKYTEASTMKACKITTSNRGRFTASLSLGRYDLDILGNNGPIASFYLDISPDMGAQTEVENLELDCSKL